MKKSEIKKMIREELLKERYFDKDEIGEAFSRTLEELEASIKRVRNPEAWAEKKFKSASSMIDTMERLTAVFSRIK